MKVPDSGVGSDCSLSSVWIDLEDALVAYVALLNPEVAELTIGTTDTLRQCSLINRIVALFLPVFYCRSCDAKRKRNQYRLTRD